MIDYYENRMIPCVAGLRRAASIDPNEPDYLFNLVKPPIGTLQRSQRGYRALPDHRTPHRCGPAARIRGSIDFLRYLGSRITL